MADAPKLIGTEMLGESYYKINMGIDNANEALKKSFKAESISTVATNTATNAVNKADNVQKQLDTLVVNGDSSVEAAQARVDVLGISSKSLKERLDKAQIDFFKSATQLKSLKGFKKFFDKLNAGLPATLVFLGDSTTEKNSYATVNHVDRITTMLKERYGDLATVINKGVGGNTALDMWERVYKDVASNKPDAIVICAGINDSSKSVPLSDSMSAYRNIISGLFATCGEDTDILCRTMNMQRNINHELHPTFIAFNNELKKLCDEFGVVYADYFSYQKSLNMTQEEAMNYYYDAIHPNDAGHELIYNFLKEFFVPGSLNYNRITTLKGLNVNHTNVVTDFNYGDTSVDPNAVHFPNGRFLNNRAGIGKKITVKFYGTGISFHHTVANSHGMIQIKIDGTVIESSYDLYYTKVLWNNVYTKKGLTLGDHTLEIEVLSQKNPNSTNYNVYIGAFRILGTANIDTKIGQHMLMFGSNVTTTRNTSGFTMRDKQTGFTIQGGFASCDKGGYIPLLVPFASGYHVNVTQSGGGGIANPTYEPVYFTSSADYQSDKFKPNWSSADAKKGINWMAFGITN
jgi:lysophospholipase L1-like esterase